MNMRSMLGSKPDEEYQAEINRMIPEIEAMLANSRRMSREARIIGESNRRRLDALEEQLKCGKH